MNLRLYSSVIHTLPQTAIAATISVANPIDPKPKKACSRDDDADKSISNNEENYLSFGLLRLATAETAVSFL